MIHYICGMKLFTMNRSYIYIFLFLIICGCSSDISHRLYDVESFISERPDSALKIVESMDRSLLKTKKDRAHHALLYAMALDKNYIDVTDDSIARVAVDYYSKKGPEKYEARALYYLGLSYYYKGEYDKAILEFTKAEKVAERSDSLYLGFVKVAQADTYQNMHNYVEELKYIQDAYSIYSSLSEHYYIYVSKLRLAQVYYNLDYIEECECLLEELISDEGVNEKIKTSALISYAFIKSISNDPDYYLSAELYADIADKSEPYYMSYKDYWVWAYALKQIGREEESQNIVNQLIDIDTSGTADYWMYMLNKECKDYESALIHLEKSTAKIDKELMDALKESLALTQRDYYESKYEIADYKVKNRTLIFCLIIVSILLLSGIIVVVFIQYIKHQREEKEYCLMYADEVKRQLEASRNADYPALKRKYVDLYKSKFEMIGSLYEQYSLFDGKKNAEHAIYKAVVSIVDDFKEESANREIIEDFLNSGMDDIMIRFRVEMPQLKEIDFTVFRFMAIGFDVTTISHLLNTTMNTIYIRKSRIKHQIETTDPEHKAQFMEIFR